MTIESSGMRFMTRRRFQESRLPTETPQERHELARQERLLCGPAVPFHDSHQFLLVHAANGNHEAAAICQLVEEGWRNRGCRGRYEDCIVVRANVPNHR